jgi:hypothetical protein
MKTTLNKIREHNLCTSGWTKLLKNLGKTQADDEPLAITTVLESNGIGDALWCLRAVDGYQREMRLFAVECARSVQHLMKDQRSIDIINVAERYANGMATDNELVSANAAARDAEWDVAEGSALVYAIASARATTRAAASSAARVAAWTAASSAARVTTMDTAGDIAGDTERETQANYLCLVCAEIEQREAV